MIAILELINNPQKMRRYLFWYLIIMPLALFAWILLGAANSGLDFKAAINIPFYAVAFFERVPVDSIRGTTQICCERE